MLKEVSEQYNKYVYPLPVFDLYQYVKEGNWDLTDPKFVRRKYWPKKIEPRNLNILIAGCGTYQAALIALNNPESQIIGIDISENSLKHQNYLKSKHNLENLKVYLLPIEEVYKLNQKFNLIISTGVLHHLKSPDAGLQALDGVLEDDGVISLMLYGKYPRAGVYMLQEAFRTLSLRQNEEDIDIVIDCINSLPSYHNVNSYISLSNDLSYRAGIVDTFLHTQDRAYSVTEILEFAKRNNLNFQGWLDNLDISLDSYFDKRSPIYKKINTLEIEKQWAVVELLTQSQARQFFLLSKLNKEKSLYDIDFTSSEEWHKYVPIIRQPTNVIQKCTTPLSPPAILKRHKIYELNFYEGLIMEQCNGRQNISQIIKKLKNNRISEEVVYEFFNKMAKLDHILYEKRN